MEGFPLGKAATSPEITRGSFSFLSRVLERKKTDKSPREKKRMRERGGESERVRGRTDLPLCCERA